MTGGGPGPLEFELVGVEGGVRSVREAGDLIALRLEDLVEYGVERIADREALAQHVLELEHPVDQLLVTHGLEFGAVALHGVSLTVPPGYPAAMSQDVTELGVGELGAAYRSGELDPVEVTEAYLDKIAAHRHARSIYRVVTAERARRQASSASRLFADGIDLGPMQGVPVAIKDLLDMAGEVSAAGSKVMAERPPAAEDAPVVARLDEAGAVFLGRTNMTELAYSGVGINPHFGTPPCALDEERVPGGSSSGSGVAVALGLAAAAVGSDTGGSVRIPAAVNGIVGLKTTDGALPTSGSLALSLTLDTIGPMARDTEDAWALYNALRLAPHTALREAAGGLSLLAPTTLLGEGLERPVADAFDHALALLGGLGHQVERSPLPRLAEAPALYRDFGSFASHEAWALYEVELTERAADFDPRVTSRILEHAERPAKDYIRLHLRREELRQRFWDELAGVDAIVAPTLPLLPPRLEDLASDEEYFRYNALLLRNTAPFNVLGSPAVSLPVPGHTAPGGLSVGLMIAARPGEEELVMRLARQLERGGASHHAAGGQHAAGSAMNR